MSAGHFKARVERRCNGLALLRSVEVKSPYGLLQQYFQHLQSLFEAEFFAAHMDLNSRKRKGSGGRSNGVQNKSLHAR